VNITFQHAKSRSMCRLYHSTRGGHSQQPTNTMSTESTQYHQDWEPVFTDNHIEHAEILWRVDLLVSNYNIIVFSLSFRINNCKQS
jgi:hypothetical protein